MPKGILGTAIDWWRRRSRPGAAALAVATAAGSAGKGISG
jgi:hypothetical protein